jgi:ADP-ribosyl-[dinitrogen reductase] hydrolase
MKKKCLIGAIAGDVIGSVFEFNNTKRLDFPLFSQESTFTDDTVLTIAVADCLLHTKDYTSAFHTFGRKYVGRGYGQRFYTWLGSKDPQPYSSYGNGSAMRVSPVGLAFTTMEKTLEEARRSAEVTHNHPEGIKGAQAVAAAIFLARHGISKPEISTYISRQFFYDLNFTTDEIRPHYLFDETCQGSVPQAIVCFLESTDYESCIRLSISIGGDSDTIACIAGGIAAAFYREVPECIVSETRKRLPEEFTRIIDAFEKTF